MASTNASQGTGKSRPDARRLRLDADFLRARCPGDRATQAAHLGVSQAQLYRWLGGRHRTGGVIVSAVTAQTVVDKLGGGAIADAWVPVGDRLTQHQRTMIATKAAHTRWAKTRDADRSKAARAGQAGLRGRFEQEILASLAPDETISPAELERRAASLLSAHMTGVRLAASRRRASTAA